jgi:hypothetical protein
MVDKVKSAARFCRQVAAGVLDMFWNFDLVKYLKIANNLTAEKAEVKISADLESDNFRIIFDVCVTNF